MEVVGPIVPIVGPIFTQLLKRLIPLAEKPLVGACNVKKDLEDIRKNMETINYVLEYTDKRALRDQHWMSGLIDVKCQMEDIIDDYEYESHLLTTAPCYKKPKRWMFCISIAKRIKVIREKLELIQKKSNELDISKFGLNSDENDKNKHRANTQASPISSNVVGRQVEINTEKILKLVTQRDENERKVSIIAITGMGGVGKTTLAQNIYSKIKDMGTLFDITCWVSVTKDTDDATLLKEMMESIDAEHNKGIKSKVTLCENLQKFVKGDNFPRKFFIVLDDIWKADMYDKLLSGPLSHGAPGSKIIITTRDEDIPKKMQAIRPFSIHVLSEEDALSLLYMNAFGNESNEEDTKDLKSIALEIVRKCAFLPLAIKAVGGVLRTKDRLEKEWRRVLISDLWDLSDFDETVMNCFNLSYEDMKLTHKQCFLYLSLFANKYSLSKEECVSCWVAEGLIEGDEGDECFKMFIQRNLLQEHPTDDDRYVMHDIVHLFVRKLSNKECAFEDGCRLQDLNIRRYSIANNNTSIFPYKDRPVDCKSLKSIMITDCKQVTQLPPSKGTFEKLRYLRVLKLNNTGITAIPDYISKLVQLRKLDLCHNPIESLPETIGKLVNLQFLMLIDCEALKALPNSLSRLTNLQWLDVGRYWKGSVPKGLDKLTKLKCLHKCADIKELGPLNSLEILSIEDLRTAEPIRAREANLMDKLNLRSLHFCCADLKFFVENPEITYPDDIVKHEELLEALCPPPCVEILTFAVFTGPRLPSWLSFKCHICLQNVTVLKLLFVTHAQLFQLGELPSLQDLQLHALPCARSLGLEFFYENGRRRADARPFRKLNSLLMYDMEELEECQWVNVDAGPSNINKEGEKIAMPFAQLNTLHVNECRKLKFLWGCLPAAAALKYLLIVDCSGLETIPELPTITYMHVVDCWSIKQAGPFHSLVEVFWEERHGKIKCLPKWLGELSSGDAPSAPSLKWLYMDISDSHMIRRLNRYDVGFDWPFIRNVPNVVVEAKYGISSGDWFEYTKSPFLIQVQLRGQSYSFPPTYRWWPMDFVTCQRSLLLPATKQRRKAEQKLVKGKENQRDDDTAPMREIVPKEDDATTPREIVCGTYSELETKLGSDILPPWDPASVTFYKTTELPFGFHAHVEVITVDGQTQILCVDQLPSAETGFVQFDSPVNIHLPYTTAQGESAVACFSGRLDLARKWPSSNKRSRATAMRP